MANILVITGPQGTGNHVFSKVLSMHNNVHGWDQLLREYWVNHDAAPFKDIWNTPENIDNYDWTEHDNYVLSVSGPSVAPGTLAPINVAPDRPGHEFKKIQCFS